MQKTLAHVAETGAINWLAWERLMHDALEIAAWFEAEATS
jgi:hypothetical protein